MRLPLGPFYVTVCANLFFRKKIVTGICTELYSNCTILEFFYATQLIATPGASFPFPAFIITSTYICLRFHKIFTGLHCCLLVIICSNAGTNTNGKH